ncbi:MAG: hypothetical protein ACYC2O_05595 [Microthrixaceae bacterium]
MSSTSRRHADRARSGPSPARRLLTGVALGGLAVTALLSTACSSDDEADSTTTTHEQHDPKSEGGDGGGDGTKAPLLGEPVSSDACGHFTTLSLSMAGGDPTVAGPSLEMFVDTLPPELTDAGTTYVDTLSAAFEGDADGITAPEFVEASQQIGDAMFEGCEVDERLDVTGVDYGFEGLPDQVANGLVALRFTNETSNEEPHEMIVLQRPPGDETPIDDIAEMTPDEVMEDFPMIGVAFADTAGAANTSFLELPAGSYIAICTIPVGGGETGDPHAAHGMIAEFEVG